MIVSGLDGNCLIGVAYFSFRRPSCYSCIRVNTIRSTSDDVIEKLQEVMSDLDSEHCSSESNYIRDSELSGDITPGQTEDKDKDKPLKACLRRAQVSKCQIPGLDYVLFVHGSGPHNINYDYAPDRPPKEVLVSRKCAEAVLRGAQVINFPCVKVVTPYNLPH